MRRELISLLNAAGRLPEVINQRDLVVTSVPYGRQDTGQQDTGRQAARPITTPVLLLHGYLSTDTPWTPLVLRLHQAGFVNVFTLRYDSLSVGVPQLAAGLVGEVPTVLSQADRPDLHLIGHSLGGLVARYAVQHLGLDRVTRSVVTVATPHHGSLLALFGPGPAAAQLRPGSVLLRELPPLETTRHVKWAVIHAGADFVVAPPPAGEVVSLAGYGHRSILSAPELAEAVVGHLRTAEQAGDDGAAGDPPVTYAWAV
jgi:pimeloyl-ACP methyl ester carboxylesterase